LQSTSGPVTEVENSVQIDAQWATLSILKLVRNWPKKRGSKFGALLWRHLTPQRKTAI